MPSSHRRRRQRAAAFNTTTRKSPTKPAVEEGGLDWVDGDARVDVGLDGRFSDVHPLARAFAFELQGRPEEDLREVLLAAVAARHKSSEARVVSAWAAMARCAEEEGTPSKYVYIKWRERQDDPEVWLTEAQIFGTFGSWTAARRAASLGGIEVSVAAARMTANGPAYTREEVLTCLRDWIEHGTPQRFSYKEYRAYTKTQLRRRDRRLPRYFRNADLATKFFGGWPAAVAAAGPQAEQARRGRERARRQAALDWIRLYAKARGGSPPTSKGYSEFLSTHREAGPSMRPWVSTVVSIFGSWDKALLEAGVINDREYRRRRAGRERETAFLLGFVIEAMDALCCTELTCADYVEWARGEVANGRTETPMEKRLRDHVGRWPIVLANAIELRAKGSA